MRSFLHEDLSMIDADSKRHADHLTSLLRGYFITQALFVTTRLSIPDHLARADGPLSVEDLATATGSHVEALYRVLRALAGEGIYEERPDRRFALTPLSTLLRADVPGSMRAATLMAGETQYKVFSLLKDSVKYGTPAFERVFRKPVFPFLADHPDIYANFNEAMTNKMERTKPALLAACDVRPGDTIVDVGGGLGTFLLALLDKHPAARGILFDGESVIAEARVKLAPHSAMTANRLTLSAGDFLHAVPAGDVMILGSVVHMFLDDGARQLLKNCRAGLRPGGRLYIIDKLVGPPNARDGAKWDDLNMLVMTGGRERTFEEFATLLREACFTEAKRAGDNLVEARVP
jgi:SAM-dependent methyltransferase